MKIIYYAVFALAVILFIIGVLTMTFSKQNFLDNVPQKTGNWAISEKDNKFDKQKLYEYIDGGAELYLSFGFKKAYNRTLSAVGQPDMIVDIFDMGSAKNAFGVFTYSREVIDTTFGQGSQYTTGLLQFWKDRYYVSILASPETEQSKQAIFTMAEKIDLAIGEKGDLPTILKLLPPDSLDQASVRYFFHSAWLNSYYFISNENILNINDDTEVVLAKYRQNDKRQILLIVKYPNQKFAETAQRQFAKQYFATPPAENIFQLENKKWLGYELIDKHFVAVFDGLEKADVELLLKKTQQKIRTSE